MKICHQRITSSPPIRQYTRHRAKTSTRWHFAFGLCCHNNETRARIANPPNSAQLGGTPTTPPSCIRVRAVVWACGSGHRQTDTQTRVTNIHFASSTTHAKCDKYAQLLFTRKVVVQRKYIEYRRHNMTQHDNSEYSYRRLHTFATTWHNIFSDKM